MHALRCAVCRDLTKFGIAIAASNPMIAITIMISINVNARRLRIDLGVMPDIMRFFVPHDNTKCKPVRNVNR